MTLTRGQRFEITETVFLKLFGLIYLIAFASLWPQVVGLMGANGVSPAAETMTAMRFDYGWRAYLDVPSLFWFWRSDAALKALCAAGCMASLPLLFGVMVRSAALAAYILYLSLVSIGQPFMSFQWDALLLETGFLAIFAGSPLLPLAYRCLLFRLMFESGLVKLTSHDVNWRNLHALRYHFYTQPLPMPLAYWMQRAPEWLLDSLTLSVLLIELLTPFFVFAFSRRIRIVAVSLLALLQIVIAVTGNYAFFNLLALALCLWGLDDECLAWFRKWRPVSGPRFAPALFVPVAAIMTLGLLQIFDLFPSFLDGFEIVNPYGLFAVMTTSRVELIVEGSDDQMSWRPYTFRYKPGDVRRGLPVVAPYQPRLDWQMWFAALGQPDRNPWAQALVYRLLSGQKEVLGLLEPAPFDKPPRFVRIQAYDYTFTQLEQRGRDGTVWQRTFRGTWLGPLSLDLQK